MIVSMLYISFLFEFANYYFLFDNLMQLGSRLIQLLIETAYVQAPVDQSADSPPDIHPAFSHTFIRLSPW